MTSNPRIENPAEIPPVIAARIRGRLRKLYGDRADACYDALASAVRTRVAGPNPSRDSRWTERDVCLITYGDQIQSDQGSALAALTDFLVSSGLSRLINTVHLLPFFPYTSDDGFSVVDYRQVDPELGEWEDIQGLAQHVDLMFDLVLNHCSQSSGWFQQFLADQPPHDRYFHAVDPAADLSQVTRPRSSPLLTVVETAGGPKHVWTTFSADQVDLNFAEPTVLVEFVKILLFFVQQGARIIRLDAIAYLWKQVGTTCIHLPETHEVVKVFHDVLEACAPHVLLLTETNVPHDENISYFGDGDEAHMVYQFSLPPLLLDAFLSQDATPLQRWLKNLAATPEGTTFFNFTASHDGIGVRPLEGLVPPARLQALADFARAAGGYVGTKRNPDGTESPYELNVTYVDALGGAVATDPEMHARRFLASQAIMLALPGVPGIYFHSLVGTQNDTSGAQSSGIPRRINRRKFHRSELDDALSQPDSLQSRIFSGYQRLLQTRIEQPAFHPDGACHVCDLGNPALFGFVRTSLDGQQQILSVVNVCGERQQLTLPDTATFTRDLLKGRILTGNVTSIEPFDVVWIGTE